MHFPQMLSWPAGSKPYDGVWAPWWYAGTHQSTGFQPSIKHGHTQQQHAGQQQQQQQQLQVHRQEGQEDAPPARRGPLPAHLAPLLEECRPLYALLRRHALKPLPAAVPRPLDGGDADALAVAGGGSSSEPQQKQHSGTHAYHSDPRNADILIGMRDGFTGAAAPCCHTTLWAGLHGLSS
jgi:hypothetical protein